MIEWKCTVKGCGKESHYREVIEPEKVIVLCNEHLNEHLGYNKKKGKQSAKH